MTREDPVDHDVAGKISGGPYGQLSDVGSVAEREEEQRRRRVSLLLGWMHHNPRVVFAYELLNDYPPHLPCAGV